MNTKSVLTFILLTFFIFVTGYSQIDSKSNFPSSGWLSFGMRSTLSTFDGDGTGLGYGGQFRIKLSSRVNTDWFGDYISINVSDKVRSEYYHIGWSVVYYPFEQYQYPRLFQPYVMAGHCFDYNKKTEMANSSNFKERWGSAVQAGIGTHLNLSEKFDISLTCQYMFHLTNELDAELNGNNVSIIEQSDNTLQGHLLTTLSFNYKLCRLWKK